MYLFLDAVSTKGKLLLTRSDKNIISEKTISLARLESQQLLGKIEEFLDASSVSFSDLSGIIVVHGPGSFTGVRTIVLLVNTLAYMYHIPLFPISFFDMYRSYPIVKASSRRDLFVQLDQDEPIQILSNEAFCAYLEENNIGQVYGDPQMNIGDTYSVTAEPVYIDSITAIDFHDGMSRIEPLYIKRPSIT